MDSGPKDSNNSAIAGQMRGLNPNFPPGILKSAKARTTNQDPVDLGGEGSKQQDVPDSESEDDRPEIFSIHTVTEAQ